ncbi:FxLD family lanthipeptide [Kitasatospora sp. NPDC056184]|uniref:FxLD family lanthipeptide n=1 Tax=Kitasatospora sp. NPDC056184 TaxID=3345738 RepID=UPI0035E18CF6
MSGSDFDLDVRIVEGADPVAALLRSTDDNCGSTCDGSACASGGCGDVGDLEEGARAEGVSLGSVPSGGGDIGGEHGEQRLHRSAPSFGVLPGHAGPPATASAPDVPAGPSRACATSAGSRGPPAVRFIAGTPGWPGPPVRNSRSPLGAAVLPVTATRRSRVPGVAPLWSRGTVRVPQRNSGASGQGACPVIPPPAPAASAAAVGAARVVAATTAAAPARATARPRVRVRVMFVLPVAPRPCRRGHASSVTPGHVGDARPGRDSPGNHPTECGRSRGPDRPARDVCRGPMPLTESNPCPRRRVETLW